MENKTVSSAKEWREKGRETEVIKLPSGASIEIRKPELLDLVFAGAIPLTLARGLENMGKTLSSGNMSDEDVQEINTMVNNALVILSINPKVIEGNAANENEISVDEILFSDKFHFFQLLTGGSKPLKPFRKVKRSPDTGGGSRKVRPKAKRNNRSRKSNKRI